MKSTNCYLNALGILCAAGDSPDALKITMLSSQPTLTVSDAYHTGEKVPLGVYLGDLPTIPLPDKKWQSRNNQFALAAFKQIEQEIEQTKHKFGAQRIAVVIGTSTSGIAESELAIEHWVNHEKVPEFYDYGLQEMGAPAQFIAEMAGVSGPVYGISTACSSGAKALATARRLIRAGICDAVIAGGVDTLCKLTVQGFSSLQAVSASQCNPFSVNRDGINIGEGAALFLVSKEKTGVELLGAGEGSDAHHISAPDPTGEGAIRCMQAALDDAGIAPHTVDYINLHGTATELNDQMESKAVNTVFGEHILCSSTKPFTGHTLGAAGAVEAGICWLMLKQEQSFVPLHIWDGVTDPSLDPIKLANSANSSNVEVIYVMSNSFAFGGNNISLLLGRLK